MPGENDIQKALELQLQLRRVFDLHAGGTKDRSGLQRVRELCDLAARATTDQICRGKLTQVQTLADALYSDRKNQKWARSARRSGVQPLRGRIFDALNAFDERLRDMLAVRRAEGSSKERSEAR
ncbi:MAG TPA: hypothetical protein VL280_06280 [Burkholderiales bacterium]|jgi:hypothetical protein|nr:hypothetical protein [Burkholderiales bacterium]